MTDTLASLMPAKKRTWILPVTIAAVLLVVAGVGAYFLWPRSLDITGRLVLFDKTYGTLNSDCTGSEASGGYKDLAEGAEVTVTDPTGAAVGLGHLGAGKQAHAGECDWPFTVTAPAGKGIYGVTVAHRNGAKFSEADLSKPLVLSIGD